MPANSREPLRLLEADLRAHLTDHALIEVSEHDSDRTVRVEPLGPDAATFLWTEYGDGGLRFEIGHHENRWEMAGSEADVDFVVAAAYAVVAGRVKEVFGPGRSRVTLTLADGETSRKTGYQGAARLLPVPRWARRGEWMFYAPFLPELMRWFTRNSDTDEHIDHQALSSAYCEHLQQWAEQAPATAAELAGLNLHDGQVQSWGWDDGAWVWSLLIGDLQRGYELVTIRYEDAEIVGTSDQGMRAMRLDGPGVEIIHEEFDSSGVLLEHRFFVWPGHSFGVRFSNAAITERRSVDGSLRRS